MTFRAALFGCLLPVAVLAQGSPNYVDITPPKPGALSAAQLKSMAQSKVDVNGGTLDAATAIARTGTNRRTAANRAGDEISVLDFLATGQAESGVLSGAVDATAAINAGLALGRAVRLPCGTLLVSGTLSLASDGSSLVGEAPGCVTINFTQTGGDVVYAYNTHRQRISNVVFNAVNAKTSGAIIHPVLTSYFSVDHVSFTGNNLSDGYLIDQANTTYIEDFDCRPYSTTGGIQSAGSCIHLTGTDAATLAADTHIRNGSSAGWAHGLQISDASGVYVDVFDIVEAAEGVLIDPADPQEVNGAFLTSILGDTTYANGWHLTGTGSITDVQCTSCWASSSALGSGLLADNAYIDGVRFFGSVFIGNYADGADLAAGKNYLFTGSSFELNNISASGAAGGNGLEIQAGVSNVTVTGSKAGPTGTYVNRRNAFTNHQNTGINVEVGASNFLSFMGNDLTDNILAGLSIPTGVTGFSIHAQGNSGTSMVISGAYTIPSGQSSLVIATGIAAPDSRIGVQATFLALPASCGVSGIAAGAVSGGSVSVNLSGVASANCPFWFRAAAFE